MKYLGRSVFLCTVVLAISGCTTMPPVIAPRAQDGRWQVTPNSAGPIRLGMTVAQARNALGSGYRLVDPLNLEIQSSAHDNSAEAEIGSPAGLITNDQFTVRDPSGSEIMKFLLANPQQPKAADNRIVMISVTSSRFATAEGVRPGVRIPEVAAIYGAPRLLDEDPEGFGREWVIFGKGPSGIRFEVSRAAGGDRLAGIYPTNASATPAYYPLSVVQALVIGRR